MKKIVVPLMLLALAGAMTGCGSSDGGSGAEKSIAVGFIGSTESPALSFPSASDAARARFEAVNAEGGVNGRKITFESCNDKGDPNEAAACARTLAQKESVAVIGGISGVGDAITGALGSAKIVYTGNRPLSPGELNSPIAFPLVGGGTSTAGGAGIYAVDELKCSSIYLAVGDVPAVRSVGEAFKAGVKSASGKEPKESVTPATSSDYSPAASAAANAKADCIYFAMSVPEIPKAIPAFRKALPEATIMTSAGNLPAPIIKALGTAADGIVLADSQLPVTSQDNETIKQFQAEMKKYAPKATADPFALSSWMGANQLVETLEGLDGTVDASSVLKAYNELGGVDGLGVIGDFSFADKSPLADQSRLFNRTYIVYSLDNGTPVVTDPSFGDATPALEQE
jgi:branched-chain amino acid transport system substrate-binding protein